MTFWTLNELRRPQTFSTSPSPQYLAPILAFYFAIVGNRADTGENFGLNLRRESRAISMRNNNGQSPDGNDRLMRASEAMEKACMMKPGAERNEAL
jgi:hypothetical protein